MTDRTWLSGCAGNTTLVGRTAWTTAYYKPQVTTTYMDYGSSWSGQAQEIGWNQPNWLPPVSDGSAVNVLTIGLILCAPDGSKDPNPAALTAAANGSDASFIPGFTGIGKAIKALGMDSPSTVIRLGHEMDGDWYPWSTNGNLALAATYAAAWRKAHDAVKAVCPSVRFNLCYCIGGSQAKLAAHYAGDSYVDFVSFDFYDAEVRTPAAFTASQNGLGFTQFGAFTAAHNKLFALDEWGLNGGDPNAANRDNPVYIQGIFDALVGLDSMFPGIVGYDSYFDMDPYFHLSMNPKSAALYKKLWNTYSAPSPTDTPTVNANTTTYTAALSTGSHTASITAINAKGESVASNTATFTVAAPTTVAGTMVGVAVSEMTRDSIVLNWTGATGAAVDGYDVFLNYQYITYVGGVGTRSYTFTGLSPATTYKVGVKASMGSTDGAEVDLSAKTTS